MELIAVQNGGHDFDSPPDVLRNGHGTVRPKDVMMPPPVGGSSGSGSGVTRRSGNDTISSTHMSSEHFVTIYT
jgi:hypothetical protein